MVVTRKSLKKLGQPGQPLKENVTVQPRPEAATRNGKIAAHHAVVQNKKWRSSRQTEESEDSGDDEDEEGDDEDEEGDDEREATASGVDEESDEEEEEEEGEERDVASDGSSTSDDEEESGLDEASEYSTTSKDSVTHKSPTKGKTDTGARFPKPQADGNPGAVGEEKVVVPDGGDGDPSSPATIDKDQPHTQNVAPDEPEGRAQSLLSEEHMMPSKEKDREPEDVGNKKEENVVVPDGGDGDPSSTATIDMDQPNTQQEAPDQPDGRDQSLLSEEHMMPSKEKDLEPEDVGNKEEENVVVPDGGDGDPSTLATIDKDQSHTQQKAPDQPDGRDQSQISHHDKDISMENSEEQLKSAGEAPTVSHLKAKGTSKRSRCDKEEDMAEAPRRKHSRTAAVPAQDNAEQIWSRRHTDNKDNSDDSNFSIADILSGSPSKMTVGKGTKVLEPASEPEVTEAAHSNEELKELLCGYEDRIDELTNELTEARNLAKTEKEKNGKLMKKVERRDAIIKDLRERMNEEGPGQELQQNKEAKESKQANEEQDLDEDPHMQHNLMKNKYKKEMQQMLARQKKHGLDVILMYIVLGDVNAEDEDYIVKFDVVIKKSKMKDIMNKDMSFMSFATRMCSEVFQPKVARFFSLSGTEGDFPTMSIPNSYVAGFTSIVAAQGKSCKIPTRNTKDKQQEKEKGEEEEERRLHKRRKSMAREALSTWLSKLRRPYGCKKSAGKRVKTLSKDTA